MNCCGSVGDAMKVGKLEKEEMNCCGSVGDAMKVGKLEKEAEKEEEEKPKTICCKGQLQSGKRVSRNILIDDDDDVYIKNPKQRKINDNDDDMNFEEEEEEEEEEDEEKRNVPKGFFSDDEIEEIDEDQIEDDDHTILTNDEEEGWGVVNRYVDDSPSSAIGSTGKLETYANLAIDVYNQVKSKEHRLVKVVSSTRYFCQGYLYSITFEAKLPGQDDSDALTLVTEVYEDFSGEREVDFVCKPDERPPYDP